MDFSGTNSLIFKRNFYTQTGNFGVEFACLLEDPSGRYELGISGTSVFKINFDSGFIFKDSILVDSYIKNRRFTIGLEFNTGHYNIHKDGKYLIIGGEKTTGNYDYVYFKRDSSGSKGFANCIISGDSFPKYTISDIGYLISSGQTGVSGYFQNKSAYPIRIFDTSSNFDFFNTQTSNSDFISSYINSFTGNINSGQSGTFSISDNSDPPFELGNFDFSTPVPLFFYTNFQYIPATFSIVDLRSYEKFVFLDYDDIWEFNDRVLSFAVPNSILRDKIELYKPVKFVNYSGGKITDSFGSSGYIELSYVGGTGERFVTDSSTSAVYSTTIYGNFLQSGILTGLASIPTGGVGGSPMSGYYKIDINKFGWAYGYATGFFSGNGTGMGYRDGYTGRAVGIVTGLVTGLIFDGSGTLNIDRLDTGLGFNAISYDYPAYYNATGYLTVTGIRYNDITYIGTSGAPIIKGVHYFNETGLSYYLSGHTGHLVDNHVSGNIIYLKSRISGSSGNSIFVSFDDCNDGSSPHTPFLISGIDSGTTGNAVTVMGPFTGYVAKVITGSGIFARTDTGVGYGTFSYTKNFTGTWDVKTGTLFTNITSMKLSGNYDSDRISGSVVLQPNTTLIIYVSCKQDDYQDNSSRLLVSGGLVANPIIELFENK